MFNYKSSSIGFLTITTIILLCLIHECQTAELSSQKGIIDLSNWDFLNDGVVELNGEWEFYPWKYYSPKDLSSGIIYSPIYVDVPAKWTSYRLKNRMPAFGFATYRIRIINNKSTGQIYAIKIPGLFSAYNLWIDTALALQCGLPGKNLKEHKPKIAPVIVPLQLRKDTLTITIQLANFFSNEYNGIRFPILFGLHEEVLDQSRLKEYFYIGSAIFCFTLGIYFFYLVLIKQERKINILFSITCFILGIRYLFDHEYIILLFFPQISTAVLIKVLCLCMNYFPIMLWSTYIFFPQEINKRIVQLTGVLFLLYTLVLIFLPFHFNGRLINTFFILCIIILLYIVIASGIAFKRKRDSAAIFFYSIIVQPIFFSYNMFAGKYYVPIGGIFLLILQAFAITSKFARSHSRVVQLSEDLQLMNENLELQVNERTKELNSANDLLKKLNTAKDKFISILSHDLRNPLYYLTGLSGRLIRNAAKKDFEEITSYSKMINESALRCYTLTENLLEWSFIQSGTKGIIHRQIIVKEIVDDIFDLLKNEAALKKIELVNSVNTDCEVYADKHMTETIFRNLVTNGIKFSHHNSKVLVSAIRFDSLWKISVSDCGIGIVKEELENLFRIDKKVYNFGTDNERGSGFGLILTKEFVESSNGTISVISEKNKGTVVTFTLPVFEVV